MFIVTEGTVRGIFVGIYVIVGVPLFAFTLGQFAGMIVESAIREREMQIMARPLGENEFKFALTLKRIPRKVPTPATENVDDKEQNGEERSRRLSSKSEKAKVIEIFNDNPPDSLGNFLLNRSAATGGTEYSNSVRFTTGRSNIMRPRAYSESCIVIPGPGINTQGLKTVSEAEAALIPEFSIDFGEFVVLEMLRLRRVDEHDLGAIRNLFDDIDYDSAGQIDEAKLERFSKLMNSSNEVEMQESGKSAFTDSRKSYHSVDHRDCDSPMSTSGHEITIDPDILASISPSRSATNHNGNTVEQHERDRTKSFKTPSTRDSDSEREMKGNISDASSKENGSSFRINGNDNMNRNKRDFISEKESEFLPLLSPSDFKANNSDNKIDVPNAFYAYPSNSNDVDVDVDVEHGGGMSVNSDSSVNSQDSNVRAKRTLTHAYNQLLMPIIRMRQLRNNSASLSRPYVTNDNSREGTPTPTTSIRKLSIDMDALNDSDCDDSALKRAGSWWFRSQTPTDDDAEKKGKNEYEYITSPHLEKEKGYSNGEDKGSGDGSLMSPKSLTHHSHMDLVEEGIRKVFGYSKYGAMNTIEEEIV